MSDSSYAAADGEGGEVDADADAELLRDGFKEEVILMKSNRDGYGVTAVIGTIEASADRTRADVALMLLDTARFPTRSSAKKALRRGLVLKVVPTNGADASGSSKRSGGGGGGGAVRGVGGSNGGAATNIGLAQMAISAGGKACNVCSDAAANSSSSSSSLVKLTTTSEVHAGDRLVLQSRLGNGMCYPGIPWDRPNFELPVIYQDDHVAIVNKPVQLVPQLTRVFPP